LHIDVLLHRAPVLAAPFDRPVHHRPALGVEDALPGDDVVLGQLAALDQLATNLLRQRRAHEGAHLVAEFQLFGRETQVHETLLSVSRARRSTKWCAADPRSMSLPTVDPGSAVHRYALHRIRGTPPNESRTTRRRPCRRRCTW